MLPDVTHDPVALVEAAIDAFRREAWDEVPPLCHPAAWLRAHAPSRELERAAREQGLSGDAVAQAMAAARAQFRFVVLGAVPDGLHVAHVLYRDAPAQDDGDAPDEARASHDAWRVQQTDDEREVTRLVADAYGPRLVMCLKRPDGAWALHAEQHLFGLGNFTVGVSVPVPEGDDPQTPE